MHAAPKCRVNHVGLHHQVLVDELGRVGVVGVDAADFGGGQVHLGGLFLCKEGLHGGLVGQVQLRMGAGDKVGLALLLKGADDGAADHAAVACDVDFFFCLVHCFTHGLNLSRTCLQIARYRLHLDNFLTAPQ